MPKLKYSERALEDLDAIYAYIAIDGVSRADSILNRILDAIEVLHWSPQAGRHRPEYGPDIRTIAAHPFVVFYRQRGTLVQILRVIDGRRDLGTVFFSPLVEAAA